jgi:hypothetical protein
MFVTFRIVWQFRSLGLLSHLSLRPHVMPFYANPADLANNLQNLQQLQHLQHLQPPGSNNSSYWNCIKNHLQMPGSNGGPPTTPTGADPTPPAQLTPPWRTSQLSDPHHPHGLEAMGPYADLRTPAHKMMGQLDAGGTIGAKRKRSDDSEADADDRRAHTPISLTHDGQFIFRVS